MSHQGKGLAPHRRPIDLYICILLLVLTMAVYSQVRHYDFVNYDDFQYVGNNPHVKAGLTIDGLAWAVTTFDAANWFPLTWLSHMADVQFFGLDAGWHHLTNVWIHVLSALLLFAALKRMTGARWPSALVAFLFALHPLHVESVAWIAERKDVLSAFFWFLTMWCYALYVARPGKLRYAAVAVAFGCGLMSKPMVVTLPFALLLLDVWPLRRTWSKRLMIEKVPLFAMSAVASVLTFLAQREGGAVAPLAGVSLGLRLANAILSYATYIRDLVWPANLAVLYPQEQSLAAVWVAMAALLLLAISIAVVGQWRQRPYLAVGWCWFLGTLLPVIGLIQVGNQSRADRYTYLPMIGLSIMLAWGLAELAQRWPAAQKAIIGVAAVACLASVAATWVQIQYWANTETLLTRALRVTRDNFILRNNLSDYYLAVNRYDDAREQAAEALRIQPEYLEAHLHLATALNRLGKPADAEKEFRRALNLRPEGELAYLAHSGLAEALGMQNRPADAVPELKLALQIEPDNADARFNLGVAYAALRRTAEAVDEFAAAIRLRPDDADAHQRLASLLAALGRWNEAAEAAGGEARLRPDDPVAQLRFASALLGAGEFDGAEEAFNEALRLKPDFEAARQGLQLVERQRKAAGK